jgi:hypothetical protein
MARTKIPTGDPNCPHHIRIAKRAYYKLIKALDGSTGGGSDELDLGLEDEASDFSDAMTTRMRTIHYQVSRRLLFLMVVMKDPTIVTKEAVQASDLTPQTSFLECRGIIIYLVMVVVQMIF